MYDAQNVYNTTALDRINLLRLFIFIISRGAVSPAVACAFLSIER